MSRRGSWSVQAAVALERRLEAALSFDEEVTLSPDDLDLLLRTIKRLRYTANRR